jgi:hypothetical protein
VTIYFPNGILGFVESFTADHPCRHCTINRAEFKLREVENYDEVRIQLKYDEAVKTGSVQDTGIKEVCILNELEYFNATENYVGI